MAIVSEAPLEGDSYEIVRGWGWRSVTPRVTRVTRARERHRRASRASSPFFVPPVHDRHARAAAAAALARSLDCARAVWRW